MSNCGKDGHGFIPNCPACDYEKYDKRIEQLERELGEATEVGIKQIETIQFLYAENKKQRKAIDDAPHHITCPKHTWSISSSAGPCDCWKKEVTE